MSMLGRRPPHPGDGDAVWREHGDPLVAATGDGPLRGLRVAVKDLYAVRGHRIGAGNPDRLAEAIEETAHAWAVRALLDAGADIAGIARTDEFAYSLNGTNAHYGTPPNPAAPGRVPGGSSSGPASAVALGQADIGLGSDTAGSVRVPASYCGLYGMRPTHGAVPVDGMLPLAPAFDTVGWLARDARTLAAIGEVLLPAPVKHALEPPHTALLAEGLAELVEKPVADAYRQAAGEFAAAAGLRTETATALGGDEVTRWAIAFATVQGAQVWASDGAWVAAHPGSLGPGIARRFARAAGVTPQQREDAEEVLRDARRTLEGLLRPGRVLLLPAASGPAPARDADEERRSLERAATFRLTCAASLAGLPCAALPAMTVEGLPVGLGAIGPAGGDHAILRLLDAAHRRTG
jgi:amidase